MNPEIRVPFVNLGLQYKQLRTEIIAKFDEISSRGGYILGNEVTQFEKNFANFCGTKHAISVGNGGDALYLSLVALGLGAGDEVITAANSFIASAWAIARTGAKPVFVDVLDDYNMDPQALRRAITSRTKALMPVHLTGRIAPMREIQAIANERKLLVVEDAAQAVGAKYYGQRAGSFGDTGCFSLHPLKNLHVHGDGGIITTNNTELADQLVKLRNHGLKNRDECVMWGFNTRLDSIQAAIADLKLAHLDKWNQRFREIAKYYSTELKSVLRVPFDQPHEESIYHRYIVTSDRRDDLQKHLLNKGIETKVNYPIPLHLQEAAKDLGYHEGSFPVTERLAQTILSLPIYAELEDAQVDLVVREVKNFFN